MPTDSDSEQDGEGDEEDEEDEEDDEKEKEDEDEQEDEQEGGDSEETTTVDPPFISPASVQPGTLALASNVATMPTLPPNVATQNPIAAANIATRSTISAPPAPTFNSIATPNSGAIFAPTPDVFNAQLQSTLHHNAGVATSHTLPTFQDQYWSSFSPASSGTTSEFDNFWSKIQL